VLIATLGIAIGGGIFTALPPKRLSLASTDPSATPTIAAGVFHIHSSRSDGTGTPDEIAAAARRAGLQFIVLTDHGDGTRQPDPPRYRDGVLCLDAVEISTTDGHYIAVGIPKAPYPLAGEGRDVVEDVKRLGGFGVVAHPDSAKGELRWREWTAPFDAIEWLNADSEWRDETTGRLAQALVTYPARPVETLTSLLDRPVATLQRWDALTERRPVVGLAGADAHARVGLRTDAADPYRSRVFVRLPGYRVSFGSFSLRVELDRPLTGDASADAVSLLTALKRGRLYSAIDGVATPPHFEFVARSGGHSARQGETLELDGPVVVDVASDAPDGGSIVLFRDGQVLAKAGARALHQELPPGSAVLRVEVWVTGTVERPPLPWIVSNPIYVSRPAQLPVRQPAATQDRPLNESTAGAGWRIEQHPGSSAAIETGPERLSVRYTLGGGAPDQFVALAITAPALWRQFDRVSFRGSADRPMRVYVQLRRPAGPDGQRWRRSVYLDRQPREATVFFDEMTPVGRADTFGPDIDNISDLLFVVDTNNTTPGQSGTFSIEALRLER
jgi:hypothetical protein